MKQLTIDLQTDMEPTGGTMTSSSQVGSHNYASPTHQPENDSARKMTATSGLRCLERYGRFSRHGSWARTFSALLIGMEGWYSTKCRLTWKLKGTKSKRMYFQLVPSTLPTEGTGFGLLRTPAAQEPGIKVDRLVTKDGQPAKIGERAYDKHTGRLAQVGIIQQIGMLPTPTAMDWKGAYPPTSIDNNPARRNMMRNAYQWMEEDYNSQTSQLNPPFVLEMMGFPPDWTELPFLSGEQNQSRPQETP